MGVHPAAVQTLNRLGHERRQEAVPVGDVAHDELEGGQVVGRDQGVGVAQVDLVLARGHLVVGRLDLEAHCLHLLDDHPADLLALVHRTQVEVCGRIVRRLLEQEELRLASRHHREAELPGPGELALEGEAGAADEGLLVGGVDIAEQPRHPPALVVVGQDAEGGEVRFQQHVRLFDPHEPLDRAAVEHDLPVQRLAELGAGHLHVLVDPQDVGELQSDEVHAEFPGELEEILLARPGQLGGEPLEAGPLGRAGRPLLGLRHGSNTQVGSEPGRGSFAPQARTRRSRRCPSRSRTGRAGRGSARS